MILSPKAQVSLISMTKARLRGGSPSIAASTEYSRAVYGPKTEMEAGVTSDGRGLTW